MIRPQYHFRDSPEGLKAWNVARLIRLSRELPVLDVPLADIAEIDEAYWSVDGAPTVRWVADHARLIRDTDPQFPVILCAKGRIMDGMHRVAAAVMRDQTVIPAQRFVETPTPDFVGIAPDDLPYDPADFQLE